MKTQVTIRNCRVLGFKRICPKQWDELAITEIESQRFCGQCEKTVYLCRDDAETLEHARRGNCIARELPDDSELPNMLLGEPVTPPVVTPLEQRALEWSSREAGIDDSLKDLDADRSCPECNFPAPNWRKSCRVCGFEIDRV